MANTRTSTKRLQIDKANSTMVITIALSAFLIVFCIMASRALLITRSYQSRVIADKEKAAKQLKDNITAADQLVVSYKAFVETPDNIIGGNPKGSGERDGDNGKIILDALPSKYDFPALATSLEKIIKGKGYKLASISGTDDEVAQSIGAAGQPQPVDMPFTVNATGTLASIQDLLKIFEASIRPMSVQTVALSGKNEELKVQITAKTYYQPEKTLNIQTKVVE